MFVTNDIKYIGVNDREIDLFEGQFKVPSGVSYNSWVIVDKEIAIMDTVGEGFGDEWLENIRAALGDRKPSYLVVLHMEPDHSANILNFANVYPEAKIVSSAKAFAMMKAYFGTDFKDRQIVVGEGGELSLGAHTLTFVGAPMVHWPEVIVAYDSADKVLFSADGFGKFGALDADEPWEDEARRYYFGIVGKYGKPVQALLKKAAALDLKMICPLHGPVLTGDLGHYISLYDKWSSYEPEEKGIVIAYTSVYGHTKAAVAELERKLREAGCEKVAVYDLARCDKHKAIADAFRFDKLVLATTTYNGGIFPPMREFIAELCERSFANHTVALVENGSWAPMAAKNMRAELEGCANISFTEAGVKITAALNDESMAQIDALVAELAK